MAAFMIDQLAGAPPRTAEEESERSLMSIRAPRLHLAQLA